MNISKMKIKPSFKQNPILPNETLNNSNKAALVGCQIQTKYGYSYSENELDEFSNSIVSSNSPPAEEIKKYIKFNIEFIEIQNQKKNSQLNPDKNSIRDQICQLFISFNELRRNYDKEIAEYDSRINEFIAKDEKLLQQLLEGHKIDQNKFEQKWSNPEYINSFYKPQSNNIHINNQENTNKSNSIGQQSQVPNTYTDKTPNESEESIQNKISKLKEIEWKDLISSQKEQINKFNENKYKYLEYLKMEKQKHLKNINCSLNQVKTKSKFIVSSKNFLKEIENKTAIFRKDSTINFDETTLDNQQVNPNTNITQNKSQYFKNKKTDSNENKQTTKKERITKSKSQMTYFKNYSSTLNLEMSNVFKNNNISKSIKKPLENTLQPIIQYPKLNQGLAIQRKNVFASKQPSIKKPQLLSVNKNLSILDPSKNNLNSSIKKTSPSAFQIKKLGNLKEVDQITPENNNVEEKKQDKNQQNKNEKIQWIENDYQFHYNQKFKDNIFFYDYKKYKLTKKNPFIDSGRKKNVFIK